MRARFLILALLLASTPAWGATADSYGRAIAAQGNVYTVTDTHNGATFSVTAGSLAQALTTINAMRPSWYVPPTAPPPTTISTSDFLARFTAAERAAVQQAATAQPATIGVGLTQGLVAGTVNLAGCPSACQDPTLKGWMDGLVTAGAITAARETAILTP